MTANRIRALIVGSLFLTASTVWAQGNAQKPATPAERAHVQTAMMKVKLDLKDDQVPKVEAINTKYAEKMDPVLKGSLEPAKKMTQAKEINDQKEAELKQVLSSDQFQKYVAWQGEIRTKMGEGAPKRPQGGAQP